MKATLKSWVPADHKTEIKNYFEVEPVYSFFSDGRKISRFKPVKRFNINGECELTHKGCEFLKSELIFLN